MPLLVEGRRNRQSSDRPGVQRSPRSSTASVRQSRSKRLGVPNRGRRGLGSKQPSRTGCPNSQGDREQRVTPLELFFDLVFVFAITQVTGFLSRNPTWGGVFARLLLLGMLWWAGRRMPG